MRREAELTNGRPLQVTPGLWSKTRPIPAALLRLFRLRRRHRVWRRRHRVSHPRHGAADSKRRIEDFSDRNAALQAMTADRFESGGRDASTVLAVGFPAKLARCDLSLEVG